MVFAANLDKLVAPPIQENAICLLLLAVLARLNSLATVVLGFVAHPMKYAISKIMSHHAFLLLTLLALPTFQLTVVMGFVVLLERFVPNQIRAMIRKRRVLFFKKFKTTTNIIRHSIPMHPFVLLYNL